MPYSARMLLSLYFPGRDCMHYAPSLDQIEEEFMPSLPGFPGEFSKGGTPAGDAGFDQDFSGFNEGSLVTKDDGATLSQDLSGDIDFLGEDCSITYNGDLTRSDEIVDTGGDATDNETE